jgi:hypothetical protein
MKVVFRLFFLSLMIAGLAAPAGAVTISAHLNAAPKSFTGGCPKVITFKGTISASNWSPTALKHVQFNFTRSDGALSPVQTLRFSGNATKAVSTTWTLGGPKTKYSGWEAIHITYPTTLDSNKAHFKLKCN